MTDAQAGGRLAVVERVEKMRMPPIAPYLAEFIGTAILLAVGLSAVSVDFGSGSPVLGWIPSPVVRRLLTGSIFAGTGTLVVYSTLGRISGGHLNPAISLAFLSLSKMRRRVAGGYIAAQIAGAFLGAILVRLAWDQLASSVNDGATMPGPQGALVAFVAEALMTFALVALVLEFVRRPSVARYTPLAAGLLVAALVTIEAPISGTSLNPARSLGPAVVAGLFNDLWIYLVAPVAGALAAVALTSNVRSALTPCAKLFHTDDYVCHFRDCQYQPGTPEHARKGATGGPGRPSQETIR